MDGWITVGTKLDTKQLEKDIKSSESKLRQYEKSAEKLTKQKAKIQVDLNAYKGQERLLKESTDEALKLAQTEEQVNWVLDEENRSIENLKQQYSKVFAQNEEIEQQLKENTNQQGLLNNEIQEMNEKLNQAKGLSNIKSQLGQIGNTLTGVIKKVTKWSLAIFSIRSAYMLVRQAMSTLSQYNEQMAVDIEYIQYAIANVLKPVIENILKIVMTILQYINYIAKAWFGKELFVSAQNFENMKKSSTGVSKNVKEIKKQLTGIDEMNVLQDDGGVSAGGVAGGITAPSIDLANWDSIEIPKWVQWIAKNKDLVVNALKLIAGAYAAIKFSAFINGILDSSKVITSFGKLLSTGLIVTGLFLIAKAVIDLITNWDKLTPSEKAAEVALGLLGVAFVALGLAIRGAIDTGTFGLSEIIGLIVALIALVGSAVLSGWSSSILSVAEAQEKLNEAIENTNSAMGTYIDAVDKAEEAEKKLIEIQDEKGISIDDLLEKMDRENLTYKDLEPAQREVYKAYVDNLQAQDNLNKSTEELNTAKENEEKANLELMLSNSDLKKDYESVKDSIVNAWKEGKLSTEDAQDLIEKAMSEMEYAAQLNMAQELPKDILDGLDPLKYQNNIKLMKNVFSDLWGSIKSGFSAAFSGIKNFFSGFSSGGVTTGSSRFATGGIAKFAVGGVSKPIKCARGSVISQPGRGVPLTSAIGGEHGAEGIVPLTNTQMMEQIGEAIGRYININLNNIVKLDNRQIAREQKIINAQNDFTSNR